MLTLIVLLSVAAMRTLTNLSALTQKDLDHLAMWMNKYPRKLLDGHSAWQLAKVYSFHFNRIFA